MTRIGQRLLVLLFLGFYLSPVLELDAEESKANYVNECHQYLNAQNEQGSIVVKTAKHSIKQECSIFFQSDFSFKTGVSASIHDPYSLPRPQKIFLLLSILII